MRIEELNDALNLQWKAVRTATKLRQTPIVSNTYEIEQLAVKVFVKMDRIFELEYPEGNTGCIMFTNSSKSCRDFATVEIQPANQKVKDVVEDFFQKLELTIGSQSSRLFDKLTINGNVIFG